MANIQANVAQAKERQPELYCPERRCLWRTGDGSYCPRHVTRAEQTRRDRIARAEAIGRSIRPNYTGD